MACFGQWPETDHNFVLLFRRKHLDYLQMDPGSDQDIV